MYKNAAILLATHVSDWIYPPSKSIYIPVQAGAALDKPIPGVTFRDNTGDNISKYNRNYCEMSVYYWAWKNIKTDIIGVGHYRRIPVKPENNDKHKLYTLDILNEELAENDCIINNGLHYTIEKDYIDYIEKEIPIPANSTYSQYANIHRRIDIDLAWEAIKLYYPEYEKTFINSIVFDNLFIACNIFIAKKDIFYDYCKWIFDILFFVQKYSPYELYDDYNKRVFGFLAERLFALYIVHNNLKCTNCCTVDLKENKKV